MKICLIHHVADLYGSSRSLLRLASALLAHDHSVRVVLQEDGPLRRALEAGGVLVRIVPSLPVLHRHRLRSPLAIAGLLRDWHQAGKVLSAWLRAERPDVVHTNSATLLPVAGLCAARLGIPHVQHIREFFTEFGLLWVLYRWVLLRYADLVVCVSHAVAAQFPSRPDVAVLHNGFPQAEFPEGGEAVTGAAWRRQFIGDRGLLVGVIGRIKLKRKGQETFVDAAAVLAERFPEARFLIVGAPFPGNEQHKTLIEGRIQDLGLTDRIRLTDEVENTKAVYAALDVVVMSSGTPEPFGGVVIEAMACGRAVVGTAIGGTAEQIEDGVTGLLVPPNDPAAMAAAVAELLGDASRRKSMGLAARRRFLECFEFNAFFEALIGHYRTLQGQLK